MSIDLEQQLDTWSGQARSVGLPPKTPDFARPAEARHSHRLVLSAGITATAVVIGFVVYAGVSDSRKGGVQTLSGQTPAPVSTPSPRPTVPAVVRPVGAKIDIVGAGTRTIDFGTPPATANQITVAFTCLTAGTFSFPGGTALACTDQGGRSSDAARTMTFHLSVTAGRQATTVTAAVGTRWHLIANYDNVKPGAWGINSFGQTYGIEGTIGTPDLVSVIATNGRSGFAYAAQLQGTPYTSPSEALAGQKNRKSRSVPVYESDGRTVIGEFDMAG